MREYLKTSLPDVLSVRSIVTVFHRKFEVNEISHGESHDFPELLYVKEGAHCVMVDDVLYPLEAGQIIIYAPLSFHKLGAPSSALVDIVSFEADSELLSRLYNHVITLNSTGRELLSQIVTAGVAVFESGREVNGLRGMAPRSGTNDYELQLLKNRMELFLIDLLHTDESKNTVPEEANRNYKKEQFDLLHAYLCNHLSENLTLEKISADCKMSVSKLKRICYAWIGCAPITYLISLRLTEAKRLMRETSMNLTEIAESLGFESLQYFSRLFKKKTGMTPSAYAKSQLKQ